MRPSNSVIWKFRKKSFKKLTVSRMSLTKLFSRCVRSKLTFSRTKNSSTDSFRRRSSSNVMKVTLLGGGGNVARHVALMLKQTPLIDELCLYDTKSLDGFASDLNYVDTKCKVTTFWGPNDMQKALKRSNVIVVFAPHHHSDGFAYSNIFDKNSPIVKDLAINIAKHSQKAVIAVGAEPINSMVPMISEIMKRHGHYNPNTIFGITTIDVVRTNKFVADILGLDPECVTVPVVGGHSKKTIVPILSQATPCNELTNEELEDVTNCVREADENLIKIRSDGACLSYAFSTARFVMSLVKGLRGGQQDIVECAFVKSKVHPQLKYMINPVLLGPGGITKNLGLPAMTDYENCLLDNAIPFLVEDIKRGEFVGGRSMEVVDGILQDKPVCDPCDGNRKAPRCPPDHCELRSLFADK